MPALNEARRAVNEEFDIIVGTNVRRFRTRREVLVVDLADAAFMDPTVLTRVEAGDRSLKLREAVEIARHLGIKVESLYKRHNGAAPNAL